MFLQERHCSEVLETSQGGFHPQKEPVLALLENDPKMDPNMPQSLQIFLKSCQDHRMLRALRRAEMHYREAKTLKNHEKACIAGLSNPTQSSRLI